MLRRSENAHLAAQQPMQQKDYTDFDEALIAPINGISRDTEERDEENWALFQAAMGG